MMLALSVYLAGFAVVVSIFAIPTRAYFREALPVVLVYALLWPLWALLATVYWLLGRFGW